MEFLILVFLVVPIFAVAAAAQIKSDAKERLTEGHQWSIDPVLDRNDVTLTILQATDTHITYHTDAWWDNGRISKVSVESFKRLLQPNYLEGKRYRGATYIGRKPENWKPAQKSEPGMITAIRDGGISAAVEYARITGKGS